MSEIEKKYEQVKDANPWIGLPVGGEHPCDDGIGSFQDYSGQASIYYTPTTDAHLINGLIREKWIQLGREKGPNGYPTADEADALSGKGRFSSFQQGRIAWKQDTPEAFAVYGAIYSKWKAQHFDAGPLGFPLTDESSTTGNTGRYNDFEQGAIYYHPTLGTHIVRSPILEAWTIADREKGLLKFPISDTPSTKDAQNAFTQEFQGGRISCTEGASRSLVTDKALTVRIAPLTRAAVLVDSAEDVDTRVLNLIRLKRYLQLKTALVIFRDSYTRSFSNAEIKEVENSYMEARTKIHEFTFGLGRIKLPTVVVVEPAPTNKPILKKSDFVDPGDGPYPTKFKAKFNGYEKVIDAFKTEGLSASDFDIVSISVPWVDTATDYFTNPGYANPEFMLKNDKTWSTVHYMSASPPSYWWAYFLHENTHCIKWMLSDYGYAQLRNPDSEYWDRSYPELTLSPVVPAPENLRKPGDPMLYALLQRIKSDWFNLSPRWGQIITSVTSLDNYGSILRYSSPDFRPEIGTGDLNDWIIGRTIVETAWSTKYLLKTKVRSHFANAYDFGVALGLASYQLSVELTGAGLQLAKDYLNNAQAAGQALKSVVMHLDLEPLKKIQFDLIPLAAFHLQLHNRLADLRDGAYSQAIHDAFLDGLSSAYLLGINMAIAEGQVSRDPMMGQGGERNLAINGLVNAKKYVGELNQQTKIQLDASRIDKLLALFTAGQMNMVIAPQISAERVSYRKTIQAAPY